MKLKKGYRLKTIADEHVLVFQGQAGAEKVITLNSTSEWLWKKLSGKEFTTDDVTGLIYAQFGKNTKQAETEALAWISLLAEASVLEA